jgi:RHS repeat-associated protein
MNASYLVNSPLVSQIQFRQSNTQVMTTTKSYDLLNRLTNISSAIGSSAIGYRYTYNTVSARELISGSVHTTLDCTLDRRNVHCSRAIVPCGAYQRTTHYTYGPFGELLRATGPMAKANPFRFSTKYQDDESDLVYYGERYYNASTGRWVSRDRISEKGGRNIYAFVRNHAMSAVDGDGLVEIPSIPAAPSFPWPSRFLRPRPARPRLSLPSLPTPSSIVQQIGAGAAIVGDAVSQAGHKFVDWCCKDKCPFGNVRDIEVEVKMLPPPETPEQDEIADTFANSLEIANLGAELFELGEKPVAAIAKSTFDVGEVRALYDSVKFAALQQKALLYIRIKYQRCFKTPCNPFRWRQHTDWFHLDTGWQRGTVGESPETGWFYGAEDAATHVDENVAALEKETFWEP